MNLNSIPLLGPLFRKRRAAALVGQLGLLELEMRDVCAQIIEITDPGDDLHVEVLELLKALDT